MSSAILYIGIVAIWAFVLVPRWLRRDHGSAETDSESSTDLGADERDQREDDFGADRARERAELPASPRSRVLQARRRILIMLLTLTGGAVACFMLKLTPWWAVVPPGGMLGLYLLLLREATVADAEQVRRRSAQAAQAAHARAARQRAESALRRAEVTVHVWDAEPSAEVIDISSRARDQLYDQYADGAVRAVGD